MFCPIFTLCYEDLTKELINLLLLLPHLLERIGTKKHVDTILYHFLDPSQKQNGPEIGTISSGPVEPTPPFRAFL